MRRQGWWIIMAFVAAGWWSGPAACVRADDSHARSEQEIRATAKQYVEALARGDGDTLRAIWLPDGDVVDEFGNATPASEIIDREVAAHKNGTHADGAHRHMKLLDSKIRFLTAGVAIEDGSVEVSSGDRPAERGRFTAVWLRDAGRWRLATLREARASSRPAEEFAALDAMVGQWVGQTGKARFDLFAQWNAKHTFLERELKVTHDGQVILDGRQRIGIDPLDGKVKSWMHDSDGGHGEGVWTRHGDAWIVHAVGVSPDGRRTASTNVYTLDGPDEMTWKSTGGFADGQELPGFEIKLKRAPGVQ